MKILVITNKSTVECTDGASVILWDFLEWFSKAGIEMHFISASKFSARNFALREPAAKLPAGVKEQLPGFLLIRNIWGSISPKIWLWRFFKRIGFFRGHAGLLNYKYSQILAVKDAEGIARFAEAEKYDVVIADYVWCAPVFSAINSRDIRKGIIAHDILQKRANSLRKSNAVPDVTEEVTSREIELLGLADFVCVETSEDRAFIHEQIPRLETFLMPRAVLVRTDETPPVEKSVLFVGGTAPHNVQGISWFLKSVWPRVYSECKEAKLRILGAVAQEITAAHLNVEMIGPVWDLVPFYRSTTVCVIPLLAGSGFKTKLIEAMGFGKACVSTPVGAEGLVHLTEPPLIIMEDAHEFAVAVIALLTNDALRRKFELRSVDYIQNFHSPNVIYSPLLEYLKRSCANRFSFSSLRL